jgi:hypothetical protein
LLNPLVDGLSIGENFAAAIWKNFTRGQRCCVAQALSIFATARVAFFQRCEPRAAAQTDGNSFGNRMPKRRLRKRDATHVENNLHGTSIQGRTVVIVTIATTGQRAICLGVLAAFFE